MVSGGLRGVNTGLDPMQPWPTCRTGKRNIVNSPAAACPNVMYFLPDSKVNVIACTGLPAESVLSLMSFMLTCILTCLWNMVGVVVAPRLYSSLKESGESTLC